MLKNITPLNEAIAHYEAEIIAITEHRDLYDQKGNQYWIDNAQIKELERVIEYLTSLLPDEKECITKAYFTGDMDASLDSVSENRVFRDGDDYYNKMYPTPVIPETFNEREVIVYTLSDALQDLISSGDYAIHCKSLEETKSIVKAIGTYNSYPCDPEHAWKKYGDEHLCITPQGTYAPRGYYESKGMKVYDADELINSFE